MKQYQVIANLSKSSWKRQELRVFDMDYNKTSAFNITIHQREPKFAPGDIINVYANTTTGNYGHPLATTYYLQNKMYIDIPEKPKTIEQIKEFYDSFSFSDRLNFNIKVTQALLRHRIIPTFNKYKNLEMFLKLSKQKIL